MIFSIYDPTTGVIVCEGESAKIRPDEEILAHVQNKPGYAVAWSEVGTPGEPARITSFIRTIKEWRWPDGSVDESGLPMGQPVEVDTQIQQFGRVPLAELDPRQEE